jgi:hypothetical protein
MDQVKSVEGDNGACIVAAKFVLESARDLSPAQPATNVTPSKIAVLS